MEIKLGSILTQSQVYNYAYSVLNLIHLAYFKSSHRAAHLLNSLLLQPHFPLLPFKLCLLISLRTFSILPSCIVSLLHFVHQHAFLPLNFL